MWFGFILELIELYLFIIGISFLDEWIFAWIEIESMKFNEIEFCWQIN